jgi:hypothetical protein
MHHGAGPALLFTHPSRFDDRDPCLPTAHDSSQEVDDMTDHRNIELDLVVCPECGAPAEIVDRFALGGTDGPVEHVKLMCLHRHWYLLPATSLPTPAEPARAPGTEPVR